MKKTVAASLLLIAALLLLPSPPTAGADDAKWRTKLARGDAIERYQVIRSAAEKKDPTAAFPLMETALKTRHPHIAVACGDALAEIGWPGKDRKEAAALAKWILKARNKKEAAPLKNLARVLGAWGVPDVDPHLAHLASGRRPADIQVEALMMCAALRPTSASPFPKVKEAVRKAFKGRSEEIRIAACTAAARVGDPSYFESLTWMVKRDAGMYTGLYAVLALDLLGYDKGIGPFLHALGANPKRTTRDANLKAVTELSSVADLEALLTLSKHAKEDYRDAAALALGRLAWRGDYGAKVATGSEGKDATTPKVPPAVIERLIAMVETEGSWRVRDAARQGLIRFEEAARPMIRERLSTSVDFAEEDLRLTAIELCGLAGAEKPFDKLVKAALHDKSHAIRMFAARALENIKPAEAVKRFLDVARAASPTKKTRPYEIHAVSALGYIRHEKAFQGLVALLPTHVKNDTLMREVEFSLERLTGHRFGMRPDIWEAWFKKADDPLHPMIAKLNRAENRRKATEKGLYGLSMETERAVERGLGWLELEQHANGHWDGNEHGGVVNCQPAYTGLSLLAFLGAGYSSTGGKYRIAIQRATDFLVATQFYDGSFPVTGGGDNSWIFAYMISMGVWGIMEAYALSEEPHTKGPAQWGIDYLVRVQGPGAGWRYGPRVQESDTSCTSWVLMTLKTGDLAGMEVPQKSLDGIDRWLRICSTDLTGEREIPDDLATDYDYEVGSRRYFKAFTSYFKLDDKNKRGLRPASMTAVGMTCRFFMGWKRSHPYMIGCANYLMDYLPNWMRGIESVQEGRWYHYYWYYGTLSMYQMGGRYWRAWNDKIKLMYPEKQRKNPPELAGSWDPSVHRFGGGRIFSTALAIMTLETYYRFSPLLEN